MDPQPGLPHIWRALCARCGKTADLSTPLRSGRDDKKVQAIEHSGSE